MFKSGEIKWSNGFTSRKHVPRKPGPHDPWIWHPYDGLTVEVFTLDAKQTFYETIRIEKIEMDTFIMTGSKTKNPTFKVEGSALRCVEKSHIYCDLQSNGELRFTNGFGARVKGGAAPSLTVWDRFIGKTFESYKAGKTDKILDTFVFKKDFADHYSIVSADASIHYFEVRGDRLVNERHNNIVIMQSKGGFDWSTGIQSRVCPPAFVQKETRDNAGEWASFSGENFDLINERDDLIDKIQFEMVDKDLFIAKGFYSGAQVYKVDQGG